MAAPKSIFKWMVWVIAVSCVAGQAAAQENPYQSRKQRPWEQRQQALERRQRAWDAFGQVIRDRTQVDPVLKKSADSIVDSMNAWDFFAESLNAGTERLSEADQIDPEDAQCLDQCQDAMESPQLTNTKGEQQDEKARIFDFYGYGTDCSRLFLQR